MTSARRVAAKHRAHTPDQCELKLRLGLQRNEGAPHLGRVCLSSSWLPELLRQGKAQNAGTTEPALLWRTGKLEPQARKGPLHIEQPGA